MPVENGPISSRLRVAVQQGAQSTVERKVSDAVMSGAKHVLGNVLPELVVDKEALDAGVHDLFQALWPEAPPVTSSQSLKVLGDAAKTFVQPELSAAERRAKLSQAAGDPLTDVVLEVVTDLASLVPAGALSSGAAALGKAMGDAHLKDKVADKWFAPFVPSGAGVNDLGPGLEKLRARLKEPGFRQELSRALDVVRVLGRLEAHNLERIALDMDKAKAPAAKEAIQRYVAVVGEAVVKASIPVDGENGSLARDLVALASLQARALTGNARGTDAAELKAIIGRLGGDVVKAPDAAAAMKDTEQAARSLPQILDDAEAKLLKELGSAGVLTPEATDGAKEILADLSAVVTTSAHLFRLFGAASNDKIPEAERVDLVKNAAKDAGPVVVKLLQTFANQAAGSGSGIDAVTHRALVELQENVPEMTEAEVRKQVEDGLGMKIEEAFTSFDMKPLASASIGQVHKARIQPRFGKEQDVVVKVQRPNLDVEFARASRVARLGLQFASELVKVMSEQGRMPSIVPDNVDPTKIMKLVEETVGSFVESFQIETDFDKERNNLKKFRRDMASHNYVTAPYVFRRWSSKTVMTMEYMRLEKVQSLIERATVARDTKKTQAPVGPLSKEDPRADVVARAVDHVARAFGIQVAAEDANVTRTNTKAGVVYRVEIATKHPLFPVVKLDISEVAGTGVIKHVLAPPILKDAEVRLVRDRFLASLMSQAVIHGRVHGDPHKGNWGLLADGKTIVMLDFGKMIDLEKKHLVAPLNLAWSWFRKDASGMADAVLTMSNVSDKPGVDKKAAKKALVAAVEALEKDSAGKIEPDQIVTTLTATLASCGLGLSPVYTQSIKAGFSFAGNFSGLAEVGAGDITLGSWARAGRITTGDALDTVTLGVVGSVLSLRKNARVSALNKPPAT